MLAGGAASNAGRAGNDTSDPAGSGGASLGGAFALEGGVSQGGFIAGEGGNTQAEPSTVSGHILSGADVPVSGAVVLVGGQRVVTDAQGAFAAANVADTYDLVVILKPYWYVLMVESLSTREPTVHVSFDPLYVADRQGSVAGRFSGGGGFPIPAGQAGTLLAESDLGSMGASTDLEPGANSYSLGLFWKGSESAPAKVTALLWTEGETGPANYVGFGQKGITLQDGALVGNVDGSVAETNLALSDPAETTVAGTISLEQSANIRSSLRVGRLSVPLSLAPGPISVVVPEVDLPAALMVATTFAPGPGAWTKQPRPTAGGTWNVTLPSYSWFQLQEPRATLEDPHPYVGPSTRFVWSSLKAHMMAHVFWSCAGSWEMHYITNKNELTLPEISAEDVAMLSSTECEWFVELSTGVDTPEEMLAAETCKLEGGQCTYIRSALEPFYR